jgi:hypothetical protein
MTDRSAFEDFEISGPRWVHPLKGWSWLACVHFTDHGHVRSYALFIQNDSSSTVATPSKRMLAAPRPIRHLTWKRARSVV